MKEQGQAHTQGALMLNGNMTTTIRSDSETDGPAGSQACKALTEPPFPTPGPWTRISPGLEPGWDVQGGGLTGGLDVPGLLLADSRLGAV